MASPAVCESSHWQPYGPASTIARVVKNPDTLVILFLQILVLLVYHAITRSQYVESGKELRSQTADPDQLESVLPRAWSPQLKTTP